MEKNKAAVVGLCAYRKPASSTVQTSAVSSGKSVRATSVLEHTILMKHKVTLHCGLINMPAMVLKLIPFTACISHFSDIWTILLFFYLSKKEMGFLTLMYPFNPFHSVLFDLGTVIFDS